jgi:DNA-binding response OmpR family regulator
VVTQEQAVAILIVEDDSATAALEKRQLEHAGYTAEIATTAAEALDKLTRNHYALLVLDDCVSGEADGVALCNRLLEAGYDLPVVMITDIRDEAVGLRLLRAGVRDIIQKSQEPLDTLPDSVGRVLRQSHTQQKLAESEARPSGG